MEQRLGAVLLAAAGNDGGYGTLYPAGYAGGHLRRLRRAPADVWATSNRNADVELSAPGVDILVHRHAAAVTRIGVGHLSRDTVRRRRRRASCAVKYPGARTRPRSATA